MGLPNWKFGGTDSGSFLGDLSPSNVLDTTKKAFNTVTAPVQGLIAGDPLYNRLKSGKWDFNPDSSINRATNVASKNDSLHRALGISDSSFGKAQRVAAGGAGLFFGGSALAGAMGGGSTAAGGAATGANAALPAGGMVGTGTTSAADATLGGVGAGAGGAGVATGTGTEALTGAAATGATGMTTAEMAKLGLMGAGTVGGLVGAFGKKNSASPSVDPTAGKSSATAQALLDQFNSGTLNVADQQGIATWHQQALAASDQYYAQAGLADSSMAQQAKAQIGQQAEQMRQQALNNYLQQGLSAAGIAAGPLATQVNATLQQDQQAQQAQSQFFQTLALMGASYGSGA